MSSSSSEGLYSHVNIRERFEEGHYIIKRLGGGKEGEVFVTIEKAPANRIYAQYTAGELTKEVTCTQLREALQAGKISNTTHTDDCQNEIEALQDMGNGRMHVAKILNADGERAGWLTSELLAGGSLALFKQNINSNRRKKSYMPPDAFSWHLLHDVTTAFLELHFGIVNAFRYPGSFNDYPDLVIIDLGRATKIDEDNLGALRDAHRDQASDVVELADCLKLTFKHMSPTDKRLLASLKRLTDCYEEEVYSTPKNVGLEHLLVEIREEASARREELYMQLEPVVAAYFNQEVVSDSEILNVMEKSIVPVTAFRMSTRRVVRTDPSPPSKVRGVSKRSQYMMLDPAERRKKKADRKVT